MDLCVYIYIYIHMYIYIYIYTYIERERERARETPAPQLRFDFERSGSVKKTIHVDTIAADPCPELLYMCLCVYVCIYV